VSIVRDAVLAINLSLIEDQLDLQAWMPEWLTDTYGYDLEECRAIVWHEVIIRAVLSCAEEAKEELRERYGVFD